MTTDNVMRLLVIVFVLLLGFLGVRQNPAGEPPPPLMATPTFTPDAAPADRPKTVEQPVMIETAEAIVLESYPMQLQLRVSGYVQDGCDFPVQTVVAREDNVIRVRIYREVAPDAMCPAVAMLYEDTIPLPGGYESGSYTIWVNDTRMLDLTL